MGKQKLTQGWINKLKPEGDSDVVYWDEGLERFGVRVKNGRISYMVQYRPAMKAKGVAAKSRRYTIGQHPTWTIEVAREEAKRLLREADSGRDPLHARREAESAITMRALVEEYGHKAEKGLILQKRGPLQGKPLKTSTVRTDQARLRHIANFFEDQRARDVSPADVERFRDKLIAEKRGPARALATLSAVMSYAARPHGIERNPCAGVVRPADDKRDVKLSPAQYRLFGAAIHRAEGSVPWQARYAARLIALTGCRRSEILELEWSEVDLSGRCLRLEDSKTGRSVRPLPDAAAELLTEVHELYSAGRKWVFPAANHTEKNRHFMGFTLCWHRMLPDELKTVQSGEPLSPHGLRHAYASLAAEMRVGELVIAHILGHSTGRSTTRGYIHVDQIVRTEANRVASAIASYLEGGDVIPMQATGRYAV